MSKVARYRWYKTISPDEKEEVMRIVEITRRTKIKAARTEYWNDPENRAKMSAAMSGENNPLFGKTPSEETREKMRVSHMGEKNANFGKIHTEETKGKIGAASRGRTHTEEFKAKMSGENNPMKRPEVRAKISGANNGNWQGGKSYEPYCSAFNEERREYVRNLNDRTCTICAKSTLQNISKDGNWIGRLAVDHLDENKMQGCADWEWRLTALCTSCHGKIQNHKLKHHLLLQLLLLNNKRHQTNFLFGVK